jgi:hypothetical protein
MGRADYLKLGDWNAICDVCGFKFKASQLLLRWDGLRTCSRDWEIRNPLDFLRMPVETTSPPWSRAEAPDTFIVFPGSISTEIDMYDYILTEGGASIDTE